MDQEIKQEFGKVSQEFKNLNQKFEHQFENLAVMIKEGFDQTVSREEFIRLQTTVATKDYLDEKLADLRGDLVVLTRKEDNKLIKLVELLKGKKILSEAETKDLFKMEPFPKFI